VRCRDWVGGLMNGWRMPEWEGNVLSDETWVGWEEDASEWAVGAMMGWDEFDENWVG